MSQKVEKTGGKPLSKSQNEEQTLLLAFTAKLMKQIAGMKLRCKKQDGKMVPITLNPSDLGKIRVFPVRRQKPKKNKKKQQGDFFTNAFQILFSALNKPLPKEQRVGKADFCKACQGPVQEAFAKLGLGGYTCFLGENTILSFSRVQTKDPEQKKETQAEQPMQKIQISQDQKLEQT